MRGFFLCGLIFVSALLASHAWAGFISLQVSTTCTKMETGVRVDVTVLNAGDEAATNIKVTARCREVSGSAPIKAFLAPGQSHEVRIGLRPQLDLPGAYPVEVRVDFHDLNHRPFSAVSFSSFIHQEGVNAQVFAEPVVVELKGRSRMDLQVLNTDQAPHQVRIRLIAPNELSAETPERGLMLPARGKGKVTFDLENFSGRDGAVYPVLAFLEYEHGGRHFLSISENTVRVVRIENFFKRTRTALVVAAAVLALAALMIQLRRGGRGGGRRKDPEA